MIKKPSFTHKTLFKIDILEATGALHFAYETDEDLVGFKAGQKEDHGEPPYTWHRSMTVELAESIIHLLDEEPWKDEIHGYKELKEFLKKRRGS